MGEGRSAFAEQEAKALNKLSREQRQRYFSDLRALQRRRFDQSQSALSRLEDCLNSTSEPNGSNCVERRDRQERARWKRELQTLRQRYNMPVAPSYWQRRS